MSAERGWVSGLVNLVEKIFLALQDPCRVCYRCQASTRRLFDRVARFALYRSLRAFLPSSLPPSSPPSTRLVETPRNTTSTTCRPSVPARARRAWTPTRSTPTRSRCVYFCPCLASLVWRVCLLVCLYRVGHVLYVLCNRTIKNGKCSLMWSFWVERLDVIGVVESLFAVHARPLRRRWHVATPFPGLFVKAVQVPCFSRRVGLADVACLILFFFLRALHPLFLAVASRLIVPHLP